VEDIAAIWDPQGAIFTVCMSRPVAYLCKVAPMAK